MPSVSPVIIHCEYKYPISSGAYIYYGSAYKDFYIYVDGSGSGGASGSYTITSSVSSMNIDMVGNAQELVITSGVPLSSSVYVEDNSYEGSVVALVYWTSGNKVYYNVYPQKTGSQTVTFKLIQEKTSTSLVIKDKITVRFYVSCSHAYNSGEITKEPTYTQTGIKTYTCLGCRTTKTETIPVLVAKDVVFEQKSMSYDEQTGMAEIAVNIENPTPGDLSAELYACIYDGSEMVKYDNTDVFLAKDASGEYMVYASCDKNAMVKLFLWKDGTVIPLAPNLQINGADVAEISENGNMIKFARECGTVTRVSDDGKEFTVRPYNMKNGVSVVLAIYDSDRFVGMYDSVYNGSEIIFTTDKPYTGAKVMVWESIESAKPVCKSETVN